MILKIRYDNEFQSIVLDEQATDELWVSLSLEDSGNLTPHEKEELIQEEFNRRYNKPEYNSWHKLNRHSGAIVKRPFRENYESFDEDDGIEYIPDNSQLEERDRKDNYDALCQQIREVLKPKLAEVLIAVVLDGLTPEEYAVLNGEKRDAVYKRLQRAKEKYKNFLKMSNSPSCRGLNIEE